MSDKSGEEATMVENCELRSSRLQTALWILKPIILPSFLGRIFFPKIYATRSEDSRRLLSHILCHLEDGNLLCLRNFSDQKRLYFGDNVVGL